MPAVLGVIALLAACGSASPRLRALEVGNLGAGPASSASAVNDAGQVVGWADAKKTKYSPEHAFLWSRGKMIDLGTLGGPGSVANGINDAGQVVGYASRPEGDDYDAFLWSNGEMIDLGTLVPSDELIDSEAFAINDSGQAVGWSNTEFPGSDLLTHAFLWSGGTLTDLGTLGGRELDSTAYDINNAGKIVGSSYVSGGVRAHAFLWSKGKMTDLGTLGTYRESSANAINDAGQIVGSSWTVTSSGDKSIRAEHAFLWSNGEMTDLGTLGGKSSLAADINGSGQVVGTSQTSSGHWHAFFWSRGKMIDLGVRGGYANGVNASGDVVGASHWYPRGSIAFPWAGTASEPTHAVLWTTP